MKCINVNHPAFIELKEKTGKNNLELELLINKWQETNGDKIPTFEDLVEKKEVQVDKQSRIIKYLDVLQPKVSKVDEQYKIEGFVQEWTRASTIAKKAIQQRSFGNVSLENEELNNLRQQAGTIIHAIQANYIKTEFPEANKHLVDTVIPIELKDLEVAVKEQLKPHVDAAKKKGSVIKSEVFIANSKSSIAGTVDLLEITKEGNYFIYDLKTRFTKEDTALRRYNKIDEWSKQTIEYKKILEKGDYALGIIPGEVEGVYILELEVIPINNGVKISSQTNFKSNKSLEERATNFLKYRQLKNVKVVAPNFLRTKDIKLNQMIDSVQGQIKNIEALKPKNEIERIAKENLFNSKLDLLQDLQLKKDINALITNAYNDLTEIEKLISDKDLKNKEQVIKEQLELYSNISNYMDEIPEEFKAELKNVRLLALDLIDKLLKLDVELIVEAANSTGFIDELKSFGKDLFDGIKDISWFRQLTMGVSTIDNPLVYNMYRTYQTASGKAREKLQDLANKIIKVKDEYVKLVGSNYDLLINYNKKGEPVLIQEFSTEFYELKKKADISNDQNWLKENVDYDVEHYKQKRNQQLEYIDVYASNTKKSIKANNPELTDAEVDLVFERYKKEKMDKWDDANKNSLSLHFKPKLKWRDSKWIAIKQGKYKGTAVEEFYDLYFNTLEVAREINPEQVHKNFIPNFTKSFIERAGNVGLIGAVKSKWTGLFNAFELDYDKELYSATDSVTGEVINQMYIPGVSDKNAKDKSTDLAASLFKFMEGVYRYQELSAVEQTVLATKRYLKNQAKFIRVDALGKEIDKIPTPNVNSRTFAAVESWIDQTFYNVKTKNETAFEITGGGFTELLGLLKKGDKIKLSHAKIIDSFLGYTSIRNLGLNLYAPIVNLLSGSANMYMTGSGGVYYNKTDLTKALNLVLGGKTNFPNEDVKKARMIIDWLNIDTSEFKKDVEKEVSSLKTQRLISKFNLLSVMQLSEGVLRDAGAIAMVLSGKNQFKWDDFNVVGDKLEVNTNIVNKEVFRQKVIAVNQKNIGGINSDDMMMAKQYVMGRILMQHRSWLPALFFERFGGKQFDYNLGKDIEGRYRTAFRLYKHLFGLSKIKELSEFEQANLKSSRAELLFLISVGSLLFLMKHAFDDDDKKEAWYKVTKKINSRVFSELIFFADPTFQNQYQILLSPAASAGTIEDLGKFIGSMYTETIETDPKKLEKNKVGNKAFKLVPGSKVYSFIEDLVEDEEKK